MIKFTSNGRYDGVSLHKDLHQYDPENGIWVAIDIRGIKLSARLAETCSMIRSTLFMFGRIAYHIPTWNNNYKKINSHLFLLEFKIFDVE